MTKTLYFVFIYEQMLTKNLLKGEHWRDFSVSCSEGMSFSSKEEAENYLNHKIMHHEFTDNGDEFKEGDSTRRRFYTVREISFEFYNSPTFK